jgi:hypothetical protein
MANVTDPNAGSALGRVAVQCVIMRGLARWPLWLEEQWLKACVSSPPVPVGAPVRESSPGGAYGTPSGSDLA